jgi:hypothetical protein
MCILNLYQTLEDELLAKYTLIIRTVRKS